MKTPLEKMAERVRHEPFFLGCLLEQYAASEQLDDGALAAELGCSPVDLRRLRLCRAPRTDAVGLLADIRQLADALGLDADRLGRVLRRATVQARFQGSPGSLMAARDRDKEAE